MSSKQRQYQHDEEDQRMQNVTECEACCYAVKSCFRCDLHEFCVPDVIACCCGWFTLRTGVLLFASIDFIWFGAIFLRNLYRLSIPQEYIGAPTEVLVDRNPLDQLSDTECFFYIGIPALFVAGLSLVGIYGVFHRSILCIRFYAVTCLILLKLCFLMPLIYYNCPLILNWWICFNILNILYNWWKFNTVYNITNNWLLGKSGDERNDKTLQDCANFTHPCVNKYACIILLGYLILWILVMILDYRNGTYHDGEVIE